MFNNLVRLVCALSRTAITLVQIVCQYIDALYLTILHESELLALRTRCFFINRLR